MRMTGEKYDPKFTSIILHVAKSKCKFKSYFKKYETSPKSACIHW